MIDCKVQLFEEKYPKGSLFFDKKALKLYVSDGDQWVEIILPFDLKPLSFYLDTLHPKKDVRRV